MVLRLVHLWNTAAGVELTLLRNAKRAADALVDTDADADLENEDPEIPNTARERRKEQRREREAALDRDRHERRAKERESEEADDSSLMLSWLASDEYHRSFEELSNDIADARLAAAHAYDRAVREQQRAQQELEDVRRNAIRLSDGRRVYFTRDGAKLFGEDRREITSRPDLAEAKRQHSLNPNAQTFDVFVAKADAEYRATDTVRAARLTVENLDRLNERIKNGGLSREELAQAQKEADAIIGGMPPAAREEYERLNAARKSGQTSPSYTAVDPVFTTAPVMGGQFRAAATAQKGEEPRPREESGTPVYKSAPDYFGPQGQ